MSNPARMAQAAIKSRSELSTATTSAKHFHLSSHQNAARASGVSAVLSGIQQAFGNQAMQRLLRTHVIQAKLTVNQPGDEYEQEADRIADAVTRAPGTSAVQPLSGPVGNASRLQRKCSSCEEEEQHLQTKA